MLIAPKRLKTRTSNLACMLPWNVSTEFLKNYFQKGAWPSSRDPVNCMALSANSYKMVGSYTVYGLQICVSSDKARIGNWTKRIVWSGDQRRHVTSRSRSRPGYLRLDNRTVPSKLQQWDRYRVPQNVYILVLIFMDVIDVSGLCVSYSSTSRWPV